MSVTHASFKETDLSIVKEERFVFKADWYDKQADLIRNYLLTFYTKDGTAEMYDMKNRRMFMKRMACNTVTANELYLGSIVNVHSRQLKLVDYGDLFTKNKFDSLAERSFGLIKPDCYAQTGKIIDAICRNGFKIAKLKMSRFSSPLQANLFYEEHKGKPYFADLQQFMQSDVVTGFELVGDNAISRFNEVCGPTDAAEAKIKNPSSIRARFGTGFMRNAVHTALDSAQMQKES